jgi:hypothetical protein
MAPDQFERPMRWIGLGIGASGLVLLGVGVYRLCSIRALEGIRFRDAMQEYLPEKWILWGTVLTLMGTAMFQNAPTARRRSSWGMS